MPKVYCCPFWKWEKGHALFCEGARIKFPDDKARQDFTDAFCANVPGWQMCNVAKFMVEYYERQ